MMRLQKWLSQLGIASRREAEIWITEGRISLNGSIVRELGTKINPERDQVSVDGKLVSSKTPPKVYWLLNKPDRCLTSRGDRENEKKTIYDIASLAKTGFLVNPVGRLDFRTEGLLLLTNDGELSYRLCRPEYHVPREYQVLIDRRLEPEEESSVRKGLSLEDGVVGKTKLKFIQGENLGQSTGAWYFITVHEGRNRLVRRIFEHFERKVVRLIRIGFGEIRLPAELPPGEYRQLTSDEIKSLKQVAKMENPVRAKKQLENPPKKLTTQKPRSQSRDSLKKSKPSVVNVKSHKKGKDQ